MGGNYSHSGTAVMFFSVVPKNLDVSFSDSQVQINLPAEAGQDCRLVLICCSRVGKTKQAGTSRVAESHYWCYYTP